MICFDFLKYLSTIVTKKFMAQLFIDNSLQYKILRTSITGLSDFLFRFKMYRLHYVVGGLNRRGYYTESHGPQGAISEAAPNNDWFTKLISAE